MEGKKPPDSQRMLELESENASLRERVRILEARLAREGGGCKPEEDGDRLDAEEYRRDEARLESLLRISQLKVTSEQELLDYALEEALQLTGSKLGHIYHYSEERRELTLNIWSREVLNQCRVSSPRNVYQLDQTGLWGEPVRQRRPLVVNDFAGPHPLKKGCPPGHVELARYCTVPVMVEERIVAVVGVANKETPYGQADTRQLTLLMDAVWKILERQRALQGLEESEARFFALVENAPEAIAILTDNRLAYLNQATARLLGAGDRGALLGRSVLDFIHPHDHQRVLRQLVDLSGYHKLAPLREITCLRQDGGTVEVEVSSMPCKHQGQESALVFVRDISQRKQAEAALRQSEEKFRQAFETNPDAININRLSDGLYLEVNEGFLAMTGFSREEVLGKTSLELNIWHDPAERQRLVEMLRTQGKVTNLEAKFRYKDGGVRVGLMSAVAMEVDGQNCILSITRDIDELKRTQAELRQWADAFHNCAHGMAIGKPGQNTFVACNPAYARMLGCRVEDLVGKPILSIYDPADHAHILQNIQSVESLGQVQYEARILRGDGSSFPVQVDLVNVADAQGKSLYRVATVQDITQRKQAEEALRRSEEKFAKAFKASPVMVSVSTVAEGKFLEVNDSFCAVTGFSRQEVIGRTSFELGLWPDPENDRQRAVEIFQRQGHFHNLERDLIFKDGTRHSVLWSVESMNLADEECFLSVMMDVTGQKTAQKEKARLEAQLRQAQKMEAIGTLAGGIAHDFNNILGAIIGYTELAQELMRDGSPPDEELAQVLIAADRARQFIRQILTFSRKAEADLRPLCLNRPVEQALAMLAPSLPKMIAIHTQLDPYLHRVNADASQMEQVLLNLATNAADAMPQGGQLMIETRNVTLSEEYSRQQWEVRPGPHVLLKVTDTGHGIDPAILDQIFEPFFTTKQVGKGTGLGLATVYGIVKSHGGHLECSSRPGGGAAFSIYLPVYREEKSLAEPTKSKLGPHLKGTETILLVDDEPSLRQLGSRTLQGMGYQVQTADCGEKALELYQVQDGALDLVVLDLGMPGMGGHRCLGEILALNPRAKVVIASGYAAHAQVREALEAGAAGFVAKPFRRVDLLTTVRQVLDGVSLLPPA